MRVPKGKGRCEPKTKEGSCKYHLDIYKKAEFASTHEPLSRYLLF